MQIFEGRPSEAEHQAYETASTIAKNLTALDFKDADGRGVRWHAGVGSENTPYVHVMIYDRWGKKGEITGNEVWDTENVDGDPLISAERHARDIAGTLAVMGIVAERPYVGNHPVARQQMGHQLSFWTIELHADQINQKALDRWAAPRVREKARLDAETTREILSRFTFGPSSPDP